MKTFFTLSFVVGRAALSWAAAPEVNPPALTNVVTLTPAYIHSLVEALRTNHPALRAASARAEAAAANVHAVRQWEDPTLSLGAATTSSRGSRLSEDGDLIYGLEQKLPLFGKTQAARRVAESGVAATKADAAYQFQLLRRDFTKAILQAAVADRVVDISAEDAAWLQTAATLAENRHRTGQGGLIEVLKLQAERDKRANEARTEVLRRSDLRVVLNRFLNRDLHSPWPRFELPPLASPVEYSVRLADLAAKHEPKLALMRREIQQAQAVVASTKRARRPDVSVGIEGRQYSGDGGFREGMFTVSMTFPWANADKYRSDLEREQARLRATELSVADQELSVREEVHHLTVLIDTARRQALLYRDQLIPHAELTLATAQASWEANRGPINDVMDARRLLLDSRLMLAKAVAEQYQRMAELVLCCGLGDLEALLNYGATDQPVPAPEPVKP